MITIDEQIQALYIAYYGRGADPRGLAYWHEILADNNGDLSLMVEAFGNSTEYLDRFETLSMPELVNGIFQQAFGRDAEPAGLGHYVYLLGMGYATLADIALRIVDGATGDDLVTLDSRVTVAGEFTAMVEQLELHRIPFYWGAADADIASLFFAGIEQGDVQEGIAGLPTLMWDLGYNDSITWGDGGSRGGVTPEGAATDTTLLATSEEEAHVGGEGTDTVDFSDSDNPVTVNLFAGTASGGYAEGDTLTNIKNLIGSNYADTLIGDNGDNVLKGGEGNDAIGGGAGADTIDGGAGIDTATYQHSVNPVTIDLLNNANNVGTDAAGDTLISIEAVLGTLYADTITGDENDNKLRGWDGADTLNGGAGNDTISGGYGNDLIYGSSGADIISGDVDIDTVSYLYSESGVQVNINAHSGNVGGDAEGDSLVLIENLTGSNHDDILKGDRGANIIIGGAGNDTISGGHHSDGDAADTLTGGDDADTFEVEFNAQEADTITDFSISENDVFNLVTVVYLSAPIEDDVINDINGVTRPDNMGLVSSNESLTFGLNFVDIVVGDFAPATVATAFDGKITFETTGADVLYFMVTDGTHSHLMRAGNDTAITNNTIEQGELKSIAIFEGIGAIVVNDAVIFSNENFADFDYLPPSLGSLDLQTESDSRPEVSSWTADDVAPYLIDDITSDTTPTFDVTLPQGSEDGDTVSLFYGADTEVGAHTLTQSDVDAGEVSITTAEFAEDGEYSIVAQFPAGQSDPLDITIDTTAPDSYASFYWLHDSGISSADGITNHDAPFVLRVDFGVQMASVYSSSSYSSRDETFVLFWLESSVGPSGHWFNSLVESDRVRQYRNVPIPGSQGYIVNEGEYVFSSSVIDFAGNVHTDKTEGQTFTIDRTLPTLTRVDIDTNGDLRLNFSEKLAAYPIAIDQFDFNIDGGGTEPALQVAFNAEKNALLIELPANADPLTLAYADDTNPLQDIAGNLLALIENYVLTDSGDVFFS